MGPPEKQPEFPGFEWLKLSPKRLFVSKRLQESNYMQAMEGGLDSSHVSFLHRGDLETDPVFKGSKGNRYNMGDLMPDAKVNGSWGRNKTALAANNVRATSTCCDIGKRKPNIRCSL